ncbi:MAG: hypothetical protein A2X13_11280 [Bacteroidetes bacterium GWC2_33_15]|nr:MAG: hypothetical protein A2X10_13470 [Bacteroidetes bacterium GWA2_33_15]OFX49248.1 MAG: hypothetical protein A2X13_11280 [Bacteroidetes bacterium GWC2_33_15]OFX65410.1 MAG: hypothetical protein A2X15_00335 [Bacteroidetes bacterium GWB2_32_14]OFX69592.1 MAG: hypothetical protein A2X14_00935 [Bacteroidetes bacterium GWD2_33_33]HAN17496.1 hypothetical protein [Bacteroidales bacterium]
MINFKRNLSNKIINYGLRFLSIISIPLNFIVFFALENSLCFIVRGIPVLLSLIIVGLFLYRDKVSLYSKLKSFILILFSTGIYTLFLGLLDMAALWFILAIIFAFFDRIKNLPLYIFLAALLLTISTGLLMMFKIPYIPIDYGFENCQFACVAIRIINFLIIGFLIFKILKMFFITIELYINEINDKNMVLEQLRDSKNNEAEQKFKNQLLKNNIEKHELELKYKNKELEKSFSKIIQFNNMFEDFKKDIRNNNYKKALLNINSFQTENYSLNNMIVVFNELYPQFIIKLKDNFPQLTETDINVCVLISSGLKSVEISRIMSVTEATVGTYRNRIRKKLNIESNVDIARFLIYRLTHNNSSI